MKFISRLFLSLVLITFLSVPAGVIFANTDLSTVQTSATRAKIIELRGLIASMQKILATLTAQYSLSTTPPANFAYSSSYPLTIFDLTGDQQPVIGSPLKVKWTYDSSNPLVPKTFLMKVSIDAGQSVFPGEPIITKNGGYLWGSKDAIPGFMQNVGKYEIQFLGLDKTITTTDNPVLSNTVKFSVVENLKDEPPLEMFYPNGGEVFIQGGYYDASPIRWNSANVAKVSLNLQNEWGKTFPVSKKIKNEGFFNWKVSTKLPNGQYKMGVFDAKSDAWDYSDNFFLISTPSSPDMNNDGKIDGVDLSLLLANWGACSANPCPGDITGDGFVNVTDRVFLLSMWGTLP